MSHRRTFSCTCALAALLSSVPCLGADLYVASYNLYNLHDRVDDPANSGDDEYAEWPEARFKKRLSNLADVIRAMNAGAGPDVLGLCEIENAEVVEALVEELELPGRVYVVVHQESPDERGIDCAIVFDDAAFDLVEKQFHEIDLPGDEKTRDITEVRLRRDGHDLFVFMNHWPSQRNPEPFRETAASTLHDRLKQILSVDADADILLLGDFNESLEASALAEKLPSVGDAEGATGAKFYATSFPIHEDPQCGTYVYDDAWQTIDHVLVSPGLLKDEGYRWKTGSTAALILFPEMLFQPAEGAALKRPNRDYSDHLPIGAVLQVE